MRKYLLALAVLAGLISPARAVDTTVSAMTAAGALDGTELLYCVQAGADRKCTPAQINTYVLSLMGAGVGTFLGTPSSANLRAALTDETGTGLAYFQGGALGTPASGTLTNATGLPVATGISGLGTGIATALGVNVGTAGAPVINGGALGTPASGTLTNATGLPISTGVSGLGAGIASWLATPSSANLATALTDETGSGVAVFGTSPTITSPTIATGMTMTFLAGGGSQCVTVDNVGVIAAAACGSGSGTVTSVGAGCGTSTGGSPITTSGTVTAAVTIRTVSGTTDTVVSGDCGGLVNYTSSSAKAVTLPQAGTAGFATGTFFQFCNQNTGTATITPTTSTIGGAASYALLGGTAAAPSCVAAISDGTNYQVVVGGVPTTDASLLTSGTLAAARLPALTNDCVSSAGSATLNCGIPRHPGYISGRWYHVTNVASLSPGAALNASRLVCHFGAIGGKSAITITGLGAGVNTAGSSNVQFAIYSNVSGRPGTLIGNTGSIANTVGNSAATGALAANKNVGPGGSDGGAELWFCAMQNDSTASYASHPASSGLAGAYYGSATASEVVTGASNGMMNGIYCQAACGGGAAAFGTWPASLATGTTWVNATPGSSGNITPQVIFQVQ